QAELELGCGSLGQIRFDAVDLSSCGILDASAASVLIGALNLQILVVVVEHRPIESDLGELSLPTELKRVQCFGLNLIRRCNEARGIEAAALEAAAVACIQQDILHRSETQLRRGR